MKEPFVYIMSNKRRGALYIGVTSDLIRRVWEHKSGIKAVFTAKHSLHLLVWYEKQGSVVQGIVREKRLKEWNRLWKIELIEAMNPEWKDFYDDLL